MKLFAKISTAAVTTIVLIALLCTSVLAAPAVNEEKTSALCNACMLVDAGTGTVIYANENAFTQIAPASTTKVLTAMLTIEKCNLADMVTVGPEVNVAGSKLGLIEGETISIKELLF